VTFHLVAEPAGTFACGVSRQPGDNATEAHAGAHWINRAERAGQASGDGWAGSGSPPGSAVSTELLRLATGRRQYAHTPSHAPPTG